MSIRPSVCLSVCLSVGLDPSLLGLNQFACLMQYCLPFCSCLYDSSLAYMAQTCRSIWRLSCLYIVSSCLKKPTFLSVIFLLTKCFYDLLLSTHSKRLTTNVNNPAHKNKLKNIFMSDFDKWLERYQIIICLKLISYLCKNSRTVTTIDISHHI